MSIDDWDFGYFGSGLEGYAHYKHAFDENFGSEPDASFDSDVDIGGDAGDDDFDSESFDETLDDESNFEDPLFAPQENSDDYEFDTNYENSTDITSDLEKQIAELEAQLEDLENTENDDFADGTETDSSPISVSLSFEWGDEPEGDEVYFAPPPSPLPDNYDLTSHFYKGDSRYDFEQALRKAMCWYFPEYKESYENTDKFNDEIISEIFEVDRDLAFKFWSWQLAHFDSALRNQEIGHVLTGLINLATDDVKWIYKTQKQNTWFWKRLFADSTVIFDPQIKWLQLALIEGDIRFFNLLMEMYWNISVAHNPSILKPDALLEAVMDRWMDDFSPDAKDALYKYIGMVDGAIRRAVLEKRCASAMGEDEDEDDADDSDIDVDDEDFDFEECAPPPLEPITNARCQQIVEERHRANPLPDNEQSVLVVYVAGLFASNKDAVSRIAPGDVLRLFREPANAYDKNAILVTDDKGNKMGYIPKKDNALIAQLMDFGASFYAVVVSCPTPHDDNMWVEVIQTSADV